MMTIIFCGFGKLGKLCVNALLINGYKIEFILTHKENKDDSVDTFALKEGIPFSYIDTRNKRSPEIKQILSIKPNFLISVNYRYIIPKEIFSLADFAFNIHGSLLPNYRGRTPHVWSIINGEEESGITSHLIEETVDTGDIIFQIKIPIESSDTGFSLLNKFETEYPKVLINSINKLLSGASLTVQNNLLASYYGKRTPDMGYIDFRNFAKEIINFVRAQAEPYPGAYYFLVDGRKIIINEVLVSKKNKLGMRIAVITEFNKHYYVLCRDYVLEIKKFRIMD